ncbi:MAG: hypothetical protein MI919_18455, partial [Holophagales bacterium]|nr:hypothetical protein [Holophagales bacterium]
FLRSEWPLTWSIPGEIDAANDDHIEIESPFARQRFGTQRYHVRFELYRSEDELVPENVIQSWAVEELREQVDDFPTVTRTDGGEAAPAMRVFGLTQLDLPAEPPRGLAGQIDELARHGIAFSRATVLRDLLAAAGRRFSELEWRVVDLEGEAAWGDAVAPGDLLRVGDRIVVLYEDRGEPGSLDYGDLCFDFVQGAEVRLLSGVFSGEGEAVEHASLRPASDVSP